MGEIARVFLKLGLASFGGPAAQIALMHRVLVEDRRWVSEAEYLSALSLCMLLPGPEAMQLATWAGWRRGGVSGGVIAGTLFLLPGAVLILGLAASYVAWGGIGWVAGLFLGVKAAVVALVIEALLRVARKALTSGTARAIAIGAFLALFVLGLPFPAVLLVAAGAGWLCLAKRVPQAVGPGPAASGRVALGPVASGSTAPGNAASGGVPSGGAAVAGVTFGGATLGVAEPVSSVPPDAVRSQWGASAICLLLWLLPLGGLWLAGQRFLFELGLFFARLALLSFGGAYALLSWMMEDLVAARGWVSTAQLIDALGLAETTPGPLILVTEFVGFLAGHGQGGWGLAVAAALVVLWMTFLPSFLFVFAAAPYLGRIVGQPRLAGALAGVTAAVVGVIVHLALIFALHLLFGPPGDGPLALPLPRLAGFDWQAALIALGASAALLIFRARLWQVLGGAALAGLGLSMIA